MARGRERSLVAVNLEQTLPIGGQRDVERARANADRGRDAQPARHARARQRVRAIVEQRHAELVERPRRVKCAERVEQRHLRVAAPAKANAACVAYAADERARAALPTMNVSRGDVDVLFAPEEMAWD